MKNILILLFISIITISLTSIQGFAHVVVKPDIVKPAVYQTFTVNVPNEKEIATVKVRLMIPEGLKSVQPTTKLGWNVNIIKDGENVKELEWTSGQIANGFRDEFGFSAKVPAEEKKLVWKAYQTYQDGTEVAWDKVSADSGSHSASDTKEKVDTPASITNITEKDEHSTTPPNSTNIQTLGLWAISIIALVLAGANFVNARGNDKK